METIEAYVAGIKIAGDNRPFHHQSRKTDVTQVTEALVNRRVGDNRRLHSEPPPIHYPTPQSLRRNMGYVVANGVITTYILRNYLIINDIETM